MKSIAIAEKPAAETAADQLRWKQHWRRELPRLSSLNLPLLGVGAGAERKAPANLRTGEGLASWTTARHKTHQIENAHKRVCGCGTRTGSDAGGLAVFDVDGGTAVSWLLERRCDPAEARTWQIHRNNDPERLKVAWRLTQDQQALVGQIRTSVKTRPPVKDNNGVVIEKGEAVELYHGSGQVVILGEHPSSGGCYYWPDGMGPEALAHVPDHWWAALLEILGHNTVSVARKASTPTTTRGDWCSLPECPICGRNTTNYCAIHVDGKTIRCFHGSTFHPPAGLAPGEVIERGGREWAFSGEAAQSNGDTFSTFVEHDPDSARKRQEEELQRILDGFEVHEGTEGEPLPHPSTHARNIAQEHIAASLATIDLADVFHPWLADRLIARAAAFPLDPLWLLAPAFTACSAIVGTRARVYVKRGWTEPLVFWTGNVAEASSLKTSAAGVWQGPLVKIEEEERTAHELASAAAQQEGGDDPPPAKRRFTDDATYEKVAELAAAKQNYGLASFQDELSGWFANLRRDCSATARAGWLKLWSGQPIVIDRKCSESVFASRCAVSLFGNVQPSKLAQMMATTGDGAESAGDGLWARFLWVRPRSIPYRYIETEVDISDDIRFLLERLNQVPAGTDSSRSLELQLEPQAIALMADWWVAWDQEHRASAPGRGAFLGKLRGYSVRIAGMLALLDAACEAAANKLQLIRLLESRGSGWILSVTPQHAERAIRLALFFLNQFDALQTEIGQGDLPPDVAALLSRARERAEAGGEVTLRQVRRWKLPDRDAKAPEALAWLRDVVVGTYGLGRLEQGTRKDSWVWIP